MRIRTAVAAASLVALAGCSSLLDTSPVDRIPTDQAILNASGARAALAGAYAGLQSLSYYGRDFIIFGDLSADNSVATGTSTSYADADANQLRAANATVAGIWNAIYDAINRTNVILEKVPALTDLTPAERDQILGEAHFLRALHYHNLVKFWAGVPIRTVPVKTVAEAAQTHRGTVAEVYTQILADLTLAEQLITSTTPTTHATVDAVRALRARIFLYQGAWANAITEADAASAGHTLAPTFGDLFDAEGIDTPEDIFKITFTAQQQNWLGYYMHFGEAESTPAQSLIDAYDANDVRGQWSISGTTEGDAEGTKFPTVAGDEDFHVVRLAELILIKAEAQARLTQLGPAVTTYNELRVRAGLPVHVLGVDVTTQAEVLAAIDKERRLELAFEGDRWPDLVRTLQAVPLLGIPATQALYPIPQAEVDVVPGMGQNPGY